MRRAYLEAASFSRLRTAFGRRIADYPLVRENLAVMRVEEQAALASTLELTALVEAVDAGTADSKDLAWHRILVNANKFVTSLAATHCVRRGIEALAGNGTIEDFSPLPRPNRDAIVFESWEGTHNVLCEQVLRDLVRLDALELVLEHVRSSTRSSACAPACRRGTATKRWSTRRSTSSRRDCGARSRRGRRISDASSICSCALCRLRACSPTGRRPRRLCTFAATSSPVTTRRPTPATRSWWTRCSAPTSDQDDESDSCGFLPSRTRFDPDGVELGSI